MDKTIPTKPCATPSCSRHVALSKGHRYCLRCEKIRRGEPTPSAGADAPGEGRVLSESVTENDNSRTISKGVNEEVRTLEDLIRVCAIDTDTWDIVEWSCNKWEVGMKLAATSRVMEGKKGHDYVAWERETNESVVLPLYQVKARMQRKKGFIRTMERLRVELVEDIRKITDARPFQTPPQHFVSNDWLFEFSPFDLHMGKLAWHRETPSSYDIQHASDLFDASVDFLLKRALLLTEGKLARILFVVGNDVCHIDTKRGTTTAGTPMDVDTRYIKIVRRIVKVHRRAVDIFRQIAPVDIVVCPGNHDEVTSFYLGEILGAAYENDPLVTIDNSPRLTKYYEFGTNLFGFTHGDAEAVAELPLRMAREQPEAWARCASREWHIGHLHKSEKWEARSRRAEQDLFSDKGIRVRRLASMSGHDAWHTKHAYMDRRACEAFIFHRTAGFTDHINFNIDHFTGKALTID